MKQDLCKLGSIHTVNVPLQSMAKGFRVRLGLHMLMIYYFSILNSYYLNTELLSDIIFPKTACTLCFRTRKRGNMRLVIYKSALTKGGGGGTVLSVKVSPS